MPVTNVHKDPQSLTMKVTAEFPAPVKRIWQLWEDPRQLERWWGPPTYPATFVDHDLRPGGRVNYFMTGPEGDQPKGWWKVVAVEAPNRLEFEDGFADEDWNPNPDMPTTTIRVDLNEQSDNGTTMTIETVFQSTEDMEQVLAMGMEEGMTEAVNQIDQLLEESETSKS
ncbi:MAG: SRPBCC family protein [Acidimicrobiia bacterium]